MDEQSTPQEATELAFDEAGQPDPVGARGGGGEEGLQIFLHHAVQDGVDGGARDVGRHGTGPSGFRAVRQCRAAARRNEIGRGPEVPGCNTLRNGVLRCPSSVGSRPSVTIACAGQARR
jgi:hypothetical protein